MYNKLYIVTNYEHLVFYYCYSVIQKDSTLIGYIYLCFTIAILSS
jgi:hypothetical protein